MTYYPYFRGKQFELIAIRDLAEVLSDADFSPIIEPVRAQLKGLGRALDVLCEKEASAVVIVNPFHGEMSSDGEGITKLLNDSYLGKDGISAGLLLTDDMDVPAVATLYNRHAEHNPVFVHAGFLDAKGLAAELGDHLAQTKHVFFERNCKRLYRRHFADANRVLLRDGFEKRRNADHPQVETFSDLHVTYNDEGMDGFGDFLTVGDDFIEGGGPAYAVAIHLTFIDDARDDEMFVYHFVSDRKDTPSDPAGKFGEALGKLVVRYQSGNSKLLKTSAILEFLRLHEQKHFPGLGQVKKLSMIHHVETLAAYFK